MDKDAFRLLRKQYKMTQEAMGNALGYSRFAINAWETGKARLPTDIMQKLASADLLAPAQKEPKLTAQDKSALEQYSKMRAQPGHVGTHAHILRFWVDAGFTPSLAAQAAILAAFPDILEGANH